MYATKISLYDTAQSKVEKNGDRFGVAKGKYAVHICKVKEEEFDEGGERN